MKKLFIISLLFLTSYLSISYFSESHARVIDYNVFDKPKVFEKIDNYELNLYSRRAIIYERNSKTILFEKNINERCPMASTTKIMTAILVLENTNLADIVTVSKKAASTGGSRLGLHTGDKISVRNLMYGLLLCSGNDAAVALAEHTGGNLDTFLDMMNKKALSLGLSNTHFESPHGLDSDEHFTTVYELAKITDYALNNQDFVTIVGTKKYTVYIDNTPKNISNTNELLGYTGVYGVKTGFTGNAGRCLVSAVKNSDLDIIVIVLGADTKSIRTSDSKKLINYAFDNYTLLKLDSYVLARYNFIKNKELTNISINKSYKESIKVYLSNIKYTVYPVLKTASKNITTTVYRKSYFSAPINKNQYISIINLYIDGEFIFSSDILSAEYIHKKNTFDYLYYFIKNFKNLVNII